MSFYVSLKEDHSPVYSLKIEGLGRTLFLESCARSSRKEVGAAKECGH